MNSAYPGSYGESGDQTTPNSDGSSPARWWFLRVLESRLYKFRRLRVPSTNEYIWEVTITCLINQLLPHWLSLSLPPHFIGSFFLWSHYERRFFARPRWGNSVTKYLPSKTTLAHPPSEASNCNSLTLAGLRADHKPVYLSVHQSGE